MLGRKGREKTLIVLLLKVVLVNHSSANSKCVLIVWHSVKAEGKDLRIPVCVFKILLNIQIMETF